MTSTFKQIADACGVTKPTVRRRIDELDLWAHVNQDATPFLVDDYACSVLAASFGEAQDRRRVATVDEDRDEVAGADAATDVMNRYIASLEARIEADRRTMDALIASNNALAERMNALTESSERIAEQVAALSVKVAERPAPFWSRLLGNGGE